jgi:hypothetical protein
LLADSEDFHICDEEGNVVIEVVNGEIITKNFNSGYYKRRFGNFSVIGDSWSAIKDFVQPSTNLYWYPSTEPSAGGYNTGNDVASYEDMWWYLFALQFRCRLIRNNAFSGSTIAINPQLPTRSFISRDSDIGDVPELIIVLGTRNDDSNSQLGEYKYSDWTEADLETYRPAVAKLLDDLKKKYIGATILFVSNSAQTAYKNSAQTICTHYNVPFLQLSLTNEQYTGSHPNKSGMSSICEQIINKLITI